MNDTNISSVEALLVIDMQNDFMPGGALEVAEGDTILPLVNNLMDEFELVVATQDWHPSNHQSFASQHSEQSAFDTILLDDGMEQTLWPDHCIQTTQGAAFHSGLHSQHFDAIIRKGTDVAIDSYSGFYDNARDKNTGLAGYLRAHETKHVHVCGLAADYCVYYTVKDALDEGFEVTLYTEATKAIDNNRFNRLLNELKENKKFYVK